MTNRAMVQCKFCPDYIPRAVKMPSNGDTDSTMDGDFDDVNDCHLAQHEHLMFSCGICKSTRLVAPIFITLSEVNDHLKTKHADVKTNPSTDIIYPLDVRRAKCRSCSHEVLASGRRPVIQHLLDHRIETKDVDASDNRHFLLGCRICAFLTSDWEAWKGHFNSARYLRKDSRIEKIRSLGPEHEAIKPKKLNVENDRKLARVFYCGWCKNQYYEAGELQDHFTGPDHARIMTRMTSAAVPLLCNICDVNVNVANFVVHIRSEEHRTALRRIVIDGEREKKMKIKVNLKKNKYVWKRVDNVFSHDDDDDVQVSEKKIDGNQNVVKGNLDAALYCQICKVQCLNQAEYDTHAANIGHLLKAEPTKKNASARKLSCPFCDNLNIVDLEDHVFKTHRGNMFICSLCDSEVAIYMDVLHTHLENKHPNLFKNLEVTLPANLMFHVCQRCHEKGKTLEGAHVEKAMVGGRDPSHKCHGSRSGLGPTPLLMECRICLSVFGQLVDYCDHDCYKTLKGCYVTKLQVLIDLMRKSKVQSGQQ